ncbi:hypothetical protein [Oceanobacillus rekensis]|uniref:hypothetical protein n=1 Tax=Oceanobacillus rekensis TaxID=937927 RepID=UPI000B450E61|nr:hypothetical protein [Oceanobacillus rekensis]
MNYIISFIIAILLTALSYFFGSRFITNGIAIWQALIIGISVVSLGAITEALRAPVWLIVLIPFPVGMLLLFLFLNKPLHTWLFTYLTILVLYTVIHMIASYFFHFHSLIPAWKLS